MDKLHLMPTPAPSVDVFEDSESNAASRDFDRATDAVAKDGFREGVAHGKEIDVQAGFDAGYRVGVEIGSRIGDIKAAMERRRKIVAAERKDSRPQEGAADEDELKELEDRFAFWQNFVAEQLNPDFEDEGDQKLERESDAEECLRALTALKEKLDTLL